MAHLIVAQEQEVTVKTRKRKHNEESWRRNVRKKLRNGGEEYVKLVEAYNRSVQLAQIAKWARS